MRRLQLEMFSFIVGMFVLVLEIAGSRLLAPAFGSTIFVWTAQICVVLTALSLGYMYGGKVKSNEPDTEKISQMSIYIAISLLIAMLLSDAMLAFSADLGPKIGPFVFSSFLFFFPCFFAGALTPIVLSIYLKNISQAGQDAGRIYAISTFGSLVGGLASSYIIIPFIGVKAGICALAFLFCIIGIALKKHLPILASFTLLLIIILAIAPAHPETVMMPRSFAAVHSFDSEYYNFRIAENGTHRILMLDNNLHSMQEIGNDALSLKYATMMATVTEAHVDGVRAASPKIGIIGLGGGSLANYFTSKGIEVDAFEIDPKVFETAVQYFGLKEKPELNVEIGDGRALISKKTGEYDALLIDAYSSTFIPAHLASAEAFQSYKNSMKSDGIIVINVITSLKGKKSYFLKSISTTMREECPYQIALYQNGNEELENIILVGSGKPLEERLLEKANSITNVTSNWENWDMNTDERTTIDYAAATLSE